MVIYWLISTMNARMMQRDLFAIPALGLREIGIGLAAFAVLLLAIPVSQRLQPPEERRKQLIYTLAPRNAKEYAGFAALSVLAGIAEEAAYRGVAVWILAPIVGFAPAVFLSAAAFTVAHAVQGGRSMGVIFGIALVFHATVELTNTLVIAMAAHTAYDLVAGAVAGRRARMYDAEDRAAEAQAPSSKVQRPAATS
jgi:membrane protease YdiL (CAAX protease family)